MRTISALFFAFFCILAQGCALGFERCPVIIGYGNYEYLGPQVIGSAGGGSFLSDPVYLFDGKPSSVTRLQWISGAQTTASFLGVEFFLANHGGDTPEDVTVGIVGILNTSLPAGLKVNIYDGTTAGILVATGSMQTNNNGTTSAWLMWTNRQMGSTQAVVQFMNDVNGSTAITASAEETIGEIFMGGTSQWGMKRDPKMGWLAGPRVRYASAGTQSSVIIPSVRTMAVNLSPVTQTSAFSLDYPEIDVETLVTSINNSQIVAVMPFENLDPSYYTETPPSHNTPLTSAKIRAKTAMLATFLQPPIIAGDGDMYYDVAMQFQESI